MDRASHFIINMHACCVCRLRVCEIINDEFQCYDIIICCYTYIGYFLFQHLRPCLLSPVCTSAGFGPFFSLNWKFRCYFSGGCFKSSLIVLRREIIHRSPVCFAFFKNTQILFSFSACHLKFVFYCTRPLPSNRCQNIADIRGVKWAFIRRHVI